MSNITKQQIIDFLATNQATRSATAKHFKIYYDHLVYLIKKFKIDKNLFKESKEKSGRPKKGITIDDTIKILACYRERQNINKVAKELGYSWFVVSKVIERVKKSKGIE